MKKEEPFGPLLATVKYQDIKFVWVSGHWDFHRDGICTFNGELCRFTCDDETDDGWETSKIVGSIYALTPAQRRRWLWRKKNFEICVGTHWSYPKVEQTYKQLPSGIYVHERSWWQRLLMILYYLPNAKSPAWWPRFFLNRWRNS